MIIIIVIEIKFKFLFLLFFLVLFGQFIIIIIADRSIEMKINISDSLTCFDPFYSMLYSLFGSVVYSNEPDVRRIHINNWNISWKSNFFTFFVLLLYYKWNMLSCRHFFIIFFFFSFEISISYSGNDGDTFNV